MNNINSYIDHTLLKPDATKQQIVQLCQEASEYNFATVCINPTWIETAKECLKDSDVGVCTVIGFPLGATLSEVKGFETTRAIEAGASEVDMVINIGALKDGLDEVVLKDISTVVEAAREVPVKVIIETCLLSDEEKVRACQLSEKAGAKFVKTSTGFSTGGATLSDVELMRATVSDKVLVKASGGVRDLEAAKKMIAAGAARLGTSSGIKILKGEVVKGY
ncbi:deoxyribose-phosphate aldolase [Halobacteriovorax marinus]|uniref:Deoxyribose-phosphate aldolase n=1 Tax=Halobacteriovorax marinus TaxID=97084 RepID=A0A1Y5F9M8_9BACT|nr:deoxyribose-phosphate aldolase [Halobacteriovorax marinus]